MTLRNLVNVKEEMLELYRIDLVLGRVISACKNQSWCFVPKKKNNLECAWNWFIYVLF